MIKRATVLATLLALVALALAGAAPAMASAAFSFSGSTSQGGPIKFRVRLTSNGLVKNFEIGWKADCTSGASIEDTTLIPRMPIDPFPRFHSSGSYMAPAAVYTATNGRTLSYAVSAHVGGYCPATLMPMEPGRLR